MQNFNINRLEVSLVLSEIQFPNGTFNLYYYQGNQFIRELIIANTDIIHLMPIGLDQINALEYSLKSLRFIRCTIKEIQAESFYYFKFRLKTLCFSDVKFGRIDPKFLYVQTANYDRLTIDRLPDEFDLEDIGLLRHHFKEITIRTSSPKFHRLTASNFTDLTEIMVIDFCVCGIQVIDSNTFNDIYDTLVLLNLLNNNLTFIDYKMFYSVISRPPNRILINVRGNPLVCTCEFYEMQNIIYWMKETTHKSSFGLILQCQDQIALNPCTNIQSVYSSRLCLPRVDKAYKYSYPKFALHFIEATQMFVVRSTLPRQFRLWAHYMMDFSEFKAKWGYTPKKCNLDGFARAAIRCYYFSKAIDLISLSLFNDTSYATLSMKQLCVSYVFSGVHRIWPLHCITVNHAKLQKERAVYTLMMSSYIAIISGIGFFILILPFVYLCWFTYFTTRTSDRVMPEFRKSSNESVYYYTITDCE